MASDLKHDLALSHPCSLSTVAFDDLRSAFATLIEDGRARIRDAGAADSDISVHLSADMRYLDQIYEVTVDVPDLNLSDDDLRARWAENMHERFEQLYAYRQQEQDIRIVTLRASAVGRLPVDGGDADTTHSRSGSETAGASASPEVTTGPTVINTDYNTVVIGEGCSASFDGNGILHIDVEAAAQAAGDAERDAVTLSVVGNRLESIAIEMMDVMLRTALSQILNASRDFSTAILDGQCRLVAQGEGIPCMSARFRSRVAPCSTTSETASRRAMCPAERPVLRRLAPAGHHRDTPGFHRPQARLHDGEQGASHRCGRRHSRRLQPVRQRDFPRRLADSAPENLRQRQAARRPASDDGGECPLSQELPWRPERADRLHTDG